MSPAGLALIEVSPNEGRRHEFASGGSLGREGTDLLFPDDDQISRRHAEIRVKDGAAEIQDLGSSNGTFVNEEAVAGVRPLQAGDTIRVGRTVLRCDLPATPTAIVGRKPLAAAAASDDHATDLVEAPGSARRGDVPLPTPSAIRPRAVAAPSAAPVPFSPPGGVGPLASAAPAGGSAARSDLATTIALMIVAADAVAIILYLALR